MIDDGSIDTLERPVGDVKKEDKTQRERSSYKLEEVPLEATPEISVESLTGVAEDDPTLWDRLKRLFAIAGANARGQLSDVSTILQNRKARSTVAVSALPALLKPQNIVALLIGLCGLAMVFLDHSSPIWRANSLLVIMISLRWSQIWVNPTGCCTQLDYGF